MELSTAVIIWVILGEISAFLFLRDESREMDITLGHIIIGILAGALMGVVVFIAMIGDKVTWLYEKYCKFRIRAFFDTVIIKRRIG